MTAVTTILVPIRYPLTDESARTLAAAGRLAQDHAPANLRVLHVNLYQTGDDTQTTELTHAISTTLDDVNASVSTQHGFIVEEVILDEATQIDANMIVVGVNHQSTWRRLISRLLRNNPDIGAYLRAQTRDDVDIMEVDTTVSTPTVNPV